jgi:hypothetical protein
LIITTSDRYSITTSDRSAILFNYCFPVVNQLSNAVLSLSSYVFISMITKTTNNLSYSFAYYLLDNSVTTTTTTTTSRAGVTTFPTLSTAATTTRLITTTSNKIK